MSKRDNAIGYCRDAHGVWVFVVKKSERSGALGRVVDGAHKGGKGIRDGMQNGAGGGRWQEGNIGRAGQVQIQAEETGTILGCAGGLGQFFAMVGRKTAGVSRAGRGEGCVGECCPAYGEKNEEQNSQGKGSEIEGAHALQCTVA